MMTPAEALRYAGDLISDGRRRILGITGPPGSGKSTLASTIADVLGPESCALLPMDGFHLDNTVLDSLGFRDRKGAPDSFDADGFVALLARVRHQAPGDLVYAPRYDRQQSLSIAGALALLPGVPLVVVEGNYLLLNDGPWAGVRPLLDLCWYVEVADTVRVPQLVERHIASGKSPDAAREWVMRSDEANARLVKATAAHADDVVWRE